MMRLAPLALGERRGMSLTSRRGQLAALAASGAVGSEGHGLDLGGQFKLVGRGQAAGGHGIGGDGVVHRDVERGAQDARVGPDAGAQRAVERGGDGLFLGGGGGRRVGQAWPEHRADRLRHRVEADGGRRGPRGFARRVERDLRPRLGPLGWNSPGASATGRSAGRRAISISSAPVATGAAERTSSATSAGSRVSGSP
jgi:hypothetical protein